MKSVPFPITSKLYNDMEERIGDYRLIQFIKSSGVNLVWNLGVVDPGTRIRFSRQIFEKFRFFQAISKTNLIFPGKYWSSTAASGHISRFLSKSHHFRTYFLYMIRYNNISRPVHDPPRPPCDSHDLCPKFGWSRPPTPMTGVVIEILRLRERIITINAT